MPSREKNKLLVYTALACLAVMLACDAGDKEPSEAELAARDSVNRLRLKVHNDSLKKLNPLLILPPDSDYTGTYVDRYDNGIVKFRGFFRFGKRHGQWLSFYPNGLAWSELHYDQGRREGPNITYFQNGKVRYSGIYRNDMRDSTWSYYDSTGKLAERVVFENDRIVKKLGPQ